MTNKRKTARRALKLFHFTVGLLLVLQTVSTSANEDAGNPLRVEIADSHFKGVNGNQSFNAFYVGDKIVLKVQLNPGTKTDQAKFVSVEIKDGWVPLGDVAEPVFTDVRPIDQVPFACEIPVDLKDRLGAWRISCRILDTDKKDLGITAISELAVVKPADKPANPEESYFGICDTNQRDPAWVEYAQRILGDYHIRSGINWVTLEPAKKGDFDPGADRVSALIGEGFYPVISTGYTPHWAMIPDRVNKVHPEWGDFSFGPPQNLADFADYIRSADKPISNKFTGDNYAWSLWNEPDEFFWQGSIDEFVSLMKVQYKTLKELNPKYKMVGFDPTGIGFVKQVCEHGGADYCDIFGIHTYMANTPEDAGLEEKIHSLRELRDKYGPGKPIWDMEYNFKGDGEPSGPEAGQAYQMVRGHVLMLSQGITRFYWWGANLPDLAGMRTSTIAAYNQQNRMLDQAQFVGKEDLKDILAGYTRCYLFERGDTVCAVLWRLGMPTSINFGRSAGCQAFDFYGNALSVNGDMVQFPISARPFYLTFPKSELDDMRKKLQAAEVVSIPDELKDKKLVKVEVEPLLKRLEDKPDLKFKIMILGGVAKGGTLTITSLPEGWKTDKSEVDFNLGGQVEGTYNLGEAAFVLSAAARNENNNALFEDKEFPIGYQIKTDTGRIYQGQKLLTWQVCTYTDTPPVIDGDLSDDWKDALPVYMGEDVQERQKQWASKDSCQWNGPDDLSANLFFMYDKENFYVGAKVRDDKQVQAGKGWEEDSIQLGIGDDFHPVIYLQGDVPKLEDLPLDTKLAIKRVGHTTTYEMAIPLAEYKFVKPELGRELGIDIVINDEDGDGRGRHILEYSEGLSTNKDTTKFKKWVFLK